MPPLVFVEGVAAGVHGLNTAGSAIPDEDTGGLGILQDGDITQASQRREGQLNVLPRGVATGMEHPVHRVSSLPGEGDLAVDGIKGDAEADEVRDAVGSLPGEDMHRLGVAETGAGGDSVLGVQLCRVIEADGGSDTALRVLSVALIDAALGDDKDTAVLPGQERGVKPGNTGADDDVVVGTRYRTSSMRSSATLA